MADPATKEAQDDAQDVVEMAAIAAQMGVLGVMAERMGKIKPGDTFRDVQDWYARDEALMAQAFAKGRAMVDAAIDRVFDGLGKGNDEWADQFYYATGTARSGEVDAALLEGRRAAKGRAGELLRTSATGIVNDYGVYTPLYQGYRAAVTRSVAAMAAGETTYAYEVERVVSALSKHGLQVRYESGAVRELYSAVSMNVMDGYRVTMNAQRMEHGAAFGADGVEVSAHENCAPDHISNQGRRYTDKEWADIQGGLNRPFVTGANCHHTVSPIIYGIGKSAWSDRLLGMNARSEEAVTFRGLGGKDLTMTRYEATQYQRKVEREIRRYKADAWLKETAGLDSGKASARAKSLTAYYRSMSEKTGLSTRMERTRLYVERS